jgi:hypothetical protein
MSDPNNAAAADSGPFTFNTVLCEETRRLRPKLLGDFSPNTYIGRDDPQQVQARVKNLRELYSLLGGLGPHAYTEAGGAVDPDRRPVSALCLSGGGIRSATFNLGVIQGLARAGVLGSFDYLSSVSGGGYIASWLRTWMCREGSQHVIAELRGRGEEGDPLAPEPTPVEHLREYSNYLTPRLGLFSADTWTAVALFLRNLILNWLVLVPLLGVLICIPQVLFLVVKSAGFGPLPGRVLLGAALLVELVASTLLYCFRRFEKDAGTPQYKFVFGAVLPIVAAAALLSTAALELNLPWTQVHPAATDGDLYGLWGFAAVWCVVIPIIGWSFSEIRALILVRRDVADHSIEVKDSYLLKKGREYRHAPRFLEFLALLGSGAVASAILVGMVRFWLPYLYNHAVLYVVLVLPLLLVLYLLARVLFVAISSLGESPARKDDERADMAGRPVWLIDDFGPGNDGDREWWARLSAWVLIVTVSWTLVTTLSLAGVCLLALTPYLTQTVTSLGGLSGIASALAGRTGNQTSGKVGVPVPSGARKWVLAVAAPLFVVCVIVLVGWCTMLLGEEVSRRDDLAQYGLGPILSAQRVSWWTYLPFLWVPVGLALISWLAGLFVNINRFSLHALYRNRLVRAYLGASNRNRRPDPFTGFSLSDNPRLHELWNEQDPSTLRPLPVINAALNLVQSGDKLAWQQRKAESFSMTPLYCGNFEEGYRRSDQYGGPRGISVGTAVTISGAAVNPNMGSSSSPAMGFLLALFNVRLGAWLGNTNAHGNKTFQRSGPHHSVWLLVCELFGLTTSTRPYVNLSDGGHFDNLGLYEMVLRRCRHILVCDAGQDPDYGFEDLGNAIRKIRIDFGIPIEFLTRIEILPGREQAAGAYCATAVIRYSAVDGSDASDGFIVYIKPTMRGGGFPPAEGFPPYDVYSYGQSQRTFPHESTVDQWFSESQFESYRMLGSHTLAQIVGARADSFRDVGEFFAHAKKYLQARGYPS